MKKTISHLMALVLASMLTIAAHAQNSVISGKIENSTSKEKVAAVSVTVKGSSEGTYTDDRGNFKLTVSKLPVTLLFTSIGYEMQEQTIISSAQPIAVSFKPSNALGQEVVISATRVAQKILESPVSIERISAATIRNAPAATYYDIIGGLKGVDVVSSSLTFKTPTTRGFSGSGNLRVNQIVDGMDNQAPGLNFSVGSFIGLNELDVDNIELLPGASSALYGPGGMNGTILINSKNPFKYQGFSMQVKEGVMNTGQRFRNASGYTNAAFRFAKKIGEKFAFKVGAEVITAKDWLGYDYRNYDRAQINGLPKTGDRTTDAAYDGVNIYGDENIVNIRPLLRGYAATNAPFLVPFINSLDGGNAPINVTRTGYAENETVDQNTLNVKVSGALHYKLTSSIEAVIAGYWGTGTSTYTGSDRYNLRNLKMGQYKVELNHKNWYVRAYTTQENAGDSYNATVTTALTNEAWKKSLTFDQSGNPAPKLVRNADGSTDFLRTDWLVGYGLTYLTGRLNGLTDFAAQQIARQNADIGRPDPGSPAFKKAFDSIRAIPINGSIGGGKFVDRTGLYQAEGQYNLSEYTKKFAEVLVGGSFKRYVLNSEGTLFADKDGKIGINEFGGYVQVSKKLLKDILKVSVSGRYDKNQNFKGRFTPRVTALIKVKENNNIRLSYQTAYRFPSTQQQWINLLVGGGVILVGGNDYFANKYNFSPATTYFLNRNPQFIKPYSASEFKPESVSTFEAGYKGLLLKDKLLIDLYGYYGDYKNFITRRQIIIPTGGTIDDLKGALTAGASTSSLGKVYSIPVNSTSKVSTYGFGISVDYRLPKGFQIGGNISSDNLNNVTTDPTEDFKAYFSTPKYRTNLTFGNTGFGKGKRLGFSVAYRWQDAFLYESDFTNGNIESFHTVDAQISYKIPASKSIIKIGGNNLFNEYYTNGVGNSIMGGLYYVSLGYNVF